MENKKIDEKSLKSNIDNLDTNANKDKLLLLEETLNPKPTSSTTTMFPPQKTYQMEGSDVLARLRNFLPQMAASNKELETTVSSDNTDFVLEEVCDSDEEPEDSMEDEEENEDAVSGEHIEINVGLGVFDVPDHPEILAALDTVCQSTAISNPSPSAPTPTPSTTKPDIQEL